MHIKVIIQLKKSLFLNKIKEIFDPKLFASHRAKKVKKYLPEIDFEPSHQRTELSLLVSSQFGHFILTSLKLLGIEDKISYNKLVFSSLKKILWGFTHLWTPVYLLSEQYELSTQGQNFSKNDYFGLSNRHTVWNKRTGKNNLKN